MVLQYNNENATSISDIHFEAVSEDSDSYHPVFNFEPISSKASDNQINLIKDKGASHDFLKRIEKLSSMTME